MSIDTPKTSTEIAVEQRYQEVLGEGPRIEPLAVDQLSDDLLVMIDNMISVNEAINAREQSNLINVRTQSDAIGAEEHTRAAIASLPEIMRTMLRHPDLFACQTSIGIQLLGKGALPPRERELAVLRIGWLCQAPYEWGEHVNVAKNAGLTGDEIERITMGSMALEWSVLDRAILKAVEELHDGAAISSQTWSELAECFDEKQLIELPILVGQYQTIAYYQNSLRLRLHEGNQGLRAR